MAELSLSQYLQWSRFDASAGVRQLLRPDLAGSVRAFVCSQSPRMADRLMPGQRLVINDQLCSPGGQVSLIMQADGNLVLYRTHYRRALWATQTSRPVNQAVMRRDGELVACSPDDVPRWASGTAGHSNSQLVVREDGNLVIYDQALCPLWASNTVQDYSSPTFGYTDADGYRYVEVSEAWKQMCTVFPCFDALQWPGYASTHVEAEIDGQAVVFQLWKGRCQQFLGSTNFPGGVGAEIGVYRRIPGKIRPSSLPFPLDPVSLMIVEALATLNDTELWWPFPEIVREIEFSLINPETGQPFFSAGPETSYWLAKWMDEASYSAYQRDQGMRTPAATDDFLLEYSINGQRFPCW